MLRTCCTSGWNTTFCHHWSFCSSADVFRTAMYVHKSLRYLHLTTGTVKECQEIGMEECDERCGETFSLSTHLNLDWTPIEREKERGITNGAEALLTVITVPQQEASEAKRQTESWRNMTTAWFRAVRVQRRPEHFQIKPLQTHKCLEYGKQRN